FGNICNWQLVTCNWKTVPQMGSITNYKSPIINSYARDKYVPSAVSTLIFSPSLMNGGTCTMSPVSVFAGLVTLDAVALFRPGSTSVTVSTTVCGNSIPTALPSKNSTLIWRFDVR